MSSDSPHNYLFLRTVRDEMRQTFAGERLALSFSPYLYNVALITPCEICRCSAAEGGLVLAPPVVRRVVAHAEPRARMESMRIERSPYDMSDDRLGSGSWWSMGVGPHPRSKKRFMIDPTEILALVRRSTALHVHGGKRTLVQVVSVGKSKDALLLTR